MIKKGLITLVFFTCFTMSIFAQCEVCETAKTEKMYCYSNENFKNYCGTFTDGVSSFKLTKKKKTKHINFTAKAEFKDFLALVNDKKLKLSAADLLFIQEALKTWETEQRELGQVYTDSGLGIKILKKGTGVVPKAGQNISVHYTGFLTNGETFDSSVKRGKPFKFQLGKGQVIKGWDEAFATLNVGSKALIKIPPKLGYGARQRGPIPANSIMFFEVELIGVD